MLSISAGTVLLRPGAASAGNPDPARICFSTWSAGNPDNPQYLAHYTRSLLQGGKLTKRRSTLRDCRSTSRLARAAQELKAQFRPGR